jgi:UDP-N-acetylglucosamine/UDP-N-acetylgalactosamine diphosphorylase
MGMPRIPNEIVQLLKNHKQLHCLQFFDELSEAQQLRLLEQIQQIDWPELETLIAANDDQTDWASMAKLAEPPPAMTLENSDVPWTREQAIQEGGQALRSGKVAAILVAGGQGTRLGFDRPKGLFPIGPLSGRTLFQMHCDRLLAVSQRYGVSIPLLVMTSPATDEETRQYFQQEQHCGLAESQLHIFCQGTMPAVNAKNGKALLESKDSLALSPDGHGGLVAALQRSGALELAKKNGIEYFYYAQVDNPLAGLCDPELIGHHLLSRSQLTTQVVKKRFAKEKVGNVVSIDGKVQIIEYSDLPDEVAELKTADGSLKLWAGNIAIHVFDRSFLQRVVDGGVGLPFHRALKKVAFIDETGSRFEPSEPNAVKFERFVFDLLPMADRAFVVEGAADEVFAPVKNADGAATDTPEQSKTALMDLHRRWIEAAGSTVEPGVGVEISPLWALDAEEVARKLSQPIRFSADTFLR